MVLQRSICRHGTELRSLKLGSNQRIGNVGAGVIAESQALSQLEVLHLESTLIGDDGARALLSSTGLPRLRELNLASNAITDAGAVAIAALPDVRLASLDLTHNRIGGAGDRALRERFGSRVRT